MAPGTIATDEACTLTEGRSDVVNYWRFENNLTDTMGNDNLSEGGASTYDSADPIAGSYSIDFENDPENPLVYITDANLSAGHPLKSGSSATAYSIGAKFRMESVIATENVFIVGKYDATNNKRTLSIVIDNVTSAVMVQHGHTSGTAAETLTHGTALSAGVEYGVVYTENITTREAVLQVYNLDTGAVVGTDATTTFTNALYIGDADVVVGNRDGAARAFDGRIDDVFIANTIWDDTDKEVFFQNSCDPPVAGDPTEAENWYLSYYVRPTAAGDGSGSSDANAMSQTAFNAITTVDTTGGDVVYFFNDNGGTFTAIRPNVSGSSTGSVYIDGYAAGSCDPVADRNCNNGADVVNTGTADSDWGIYADNESYLVIQDFNVRDSGAGIGVWSNTATPRSNIVVRRNHIHDIEWKGLVVGADNISQRVDTITIGGASGDGNLVFDTMQVFAPPYANCGGDAYPQTCEGAHTSFIGDNLIVSYNEVGQTAKTDIHGSNGIEIHSHHNQLVEYNTVYTPDGQAGISVKEYGGIGKIIRFNKLYDCATGVSISTENYPSESWKLANEDVYVYGNFIFNGGTGVRTYKEYQDIHIFNNIIANNTSRGIYHFTGYGTPGPVFTHNNTLYRNGDTVGDSWNNVGLQILDSSGNYTQLLVDARNNIMQENSVGVGNYRQAHVWPNNEKNLAWFDYNVFHDPAGGAGGEDMYYNSAARDIAYLNSQLVTEGKSAGNNYEGDPGLTDPDGADNTHGTADDDFTLDGTYRNNGLDISQCFNVTIQGSVYTVCYDDALDPANTDWTTTPPTVVTIKQDSYGAGWERGAYAYVE